MNRQFSALAGLAVLAAGAAGCAVTPDDGLPVGPTAADKHRITVSEVGERIEIPVGAGDLTLSSAAQADLARLARAYNDGGHGPLVLSTPSGGPNAAAASGLSQQARLVLQENGVPYGAIAGATYDGTGRDAAPITVSYMRFEATPPVCAPLYTQDLAHPDSNQPYESFGCSAANNLAALVADPHDLIAPRDETPRDSGRRATVMRHYRAGEQTHATRTDDEHVTVSDAVN